MGRNSELAGDKMSDVDGLICLMDEDGAKKEEEDDEDDDEEELHFTGWAE